MEGKYYSDLEGSACMEEEWLSDLGSQVAGSEDGLTNLSSFRQVGFLRVCWHAQVATNCLFKENLGPLALQLVVG